jgi:hypothetical protein
MNLKKPGSLHCADLQHSLTYSPLCRLLANARLNGTFAGNVPRSEEVFNRPQLHDIRQFSGLQQSFWQSHHYLPQCLYWTWSYNIRRCDHW